ncbi:hypothetical protein Bca4012_100888 [Brassica carinata]
MKVKTMYMLFKTRRAEDPDHKSNKAVKPDQPPPFVKEFVSRKRREASNKGRRRIRIREAI